MPCQHPYPRDSYPIYVQNPLDKLLKEKLDNVTDLLCLVCSSVDDVSKLPFQVAAWYEEHKNQDRDRLLEQFEIKLKKLDGGKLREIEAILDSVK